MLLFVAKYLRNHFHWSDNMNSSLPLSLLRINFNFCL